MRKTHNQKLARVRQEIENCKSFRYLDDRVVEVEEEIADILGLNEYPDNDDYGGPMILLPPPHGGFIIELKVTHEPEHHISRMSKQDEQIAAEENDAP